MYRGRRGEPDGDCAVKALPLSAFFLAFTAYGADQFVAASISPVFVSDCARGQAVLFSNVPTVQSLRVCLAMENLLPARLKRAESELNANRRFADNRAVGIADFQFEFN